MPDRFDEVDLLEAVKDLATLRYFPGESKTAIMRHLAAMCPSLRALRYTIDHVLAATGEWPGLAEIRGVLCNGFDPADGLFAYSTLPGCSPAENEARYLAEQHEPLKQLSAAMDAKAIAQLMAPEPTSGK